MAVGKRIYLKRHMPDKEVMMQFKNIPASNTCDVMGRNAAMNPRIRLVSQPKEQMAVGPALTVKARGGDNLALHAPDLEPAEHFRRCVDSDLRPVFPGSYLYIQMNSDLRNLP